MARLAAARRVVCVGAGAIAARLLVSGLDPRPVDVMRLLAVDGAALIYTIVATFPGQARQQATVWSAPARTWNARRLSFSRCALAGAEDEEEDLSDDTDVWPTERTLMRPEPRAEPRQQPDEIADLFLAQAGLAAARTAYAAVEDANIPGWSGPPTNSSTRVTAASSRRTSATPTSTSLFKLHP